jgi:hypothetical protein
MNHESPRGRPRSGGDRRLRATLANGALYCPAAPAALLELGPLARGATEAETAAHDANPSLSIAQYLHDMLGYFAISYRRVGYFGRLRVWVSLEDGEGSQLGLGSDYLAFDRKPLSINCLAFKSRKNASVSGSGSPRSSLEPIF